MRWDVTDNQGMFRRVLGDGVVGVASASAFAAGNRAVCESRERKQVNSAMRRVQRKKRKAAMNGCRVR